MAHWAQFVLLIQSKVKSKNLAKDVIYSCNNIIVISYTKSLLISYFQKQEFQYKRIFTFHFMCYICIEKRLIVKFAKPNLEIYKSGET